MPTVQLSGILAKFRDIDEKLTDVMADLDAYGMDTVAIQTGVSVDPCAPFIIISPPPPPPLFTGCHPRIAKQDPPIKGSDLKRIAEYQHQWTSEMLAIFRRMGELDGE